MDDKNLTIIIIDDSFDTEEKIISTLRTAGYAVKSTRVEDEEDLLIAIKDRPPELIIYSQGMELISLKDTCKCIKKIPEIECVPVIAVDKKNEESTVVKAMSAGATDLSSYENMAHLKQVIIREITSFRNWKNIADLNNVLVETEKRCSSLLDSSRDAIAYVHEGMHVYSNQSFVELFGFESPDDIESLPILDMVAEQKRDEFKEFLRKYMKGESGMEEFTTRLVKIDGVEFEGDMEFSNASIDGEPCTQVVIRLKYTDTDELEQQLKMVSQQDNVTGLFNRQYCLEILEATVEDALAEQFVAALMEIQIDNFEMIKEKLGVAGTDEFIQKTAQVLKDVAREDDVISRYMHSSFTIIAYRLNAKEMETYGLKIQSAMSDMEATINDESVNTTCSIGISMIDKNSPDSNEILARVERATNEAQELGNNKIKIYVPKKGEMTSTERDNELRKQITDALRYDKFELHFQPIVSLHGDTDHRYEVFVRLVQDAEEGSDKDELIMPQDFLPSAERIGMATAIDRWVLNKTISELSERWKQGQRIRFFIKLSASSLQDDTLIEWLKFQIKEKGLPPDTLLFEVKESVAVTNLKNTKALSEALRSINCGFVLDEFGTGTNPFQILEHIHVDFVRLAQEFMTDILENEKNQESIQHIANKASGLGKMTIAQHVQDVNSLSLLWGMGIHFIQGYVLQEPQPHLDYDFTEMSG